MPSDDFTTQVAALTERAETNIPIDSPDTVPEKHALTVKEQNQRIKWFMQESLVSLACRALIYEAGAVRPRLVLVPARDEWDPASGASASSEDLDVTAWFNGEQAGITSLYSFPGTDCHLGNAYDIIALPPRFQAAESIPENKALAAQFGVKWLGNILVVKRARYDRTRVISITSSEITLINAMIHRWLQLRDADAT